MASGGLAQVILPAAAEQGADQRQPQVGGDVRHGVTDLAIAKQHQCAAGGHSYHDDDQHGDDGRLQAHRMQRVDHLERKARMGLVAEGDRQQREQGGQADPFRQAGQQQADQHQGRARRIGAAEGEEHAHGQGSWRSGGTAAAGDPGARSLPVPVNACLPCVEPPVATVKPGRPYARDDRSPQPLAAGDRASGRMPG